MNPHAGTARHVHGVLVAAGLPSVLPVPVPTVPVAAVGAVVVGSPTLPEQEVATGCGPSLMTCDVTVIAAGVTPGAIGDLYDRTDRALTALLDAGAWNPVTTPTTWAAQDMQPLPAITLTVSVGHPQE